MGPEELKAIKEKLNTQGMQMDKNGEGEDGGNAVYFGTKEEVTKARQLAETEGRAPDLASYIVMHKKVLASPSEMQNVLRWGDVRRFAFKDLPIGAMFTSRSGYTGLEIHFKDSSGNLAKVVIEPEKIASIQKEASTALDPTARYFSVITAQLNELGFRSNEGFSKLDPIRMELEIQDHHLQKVKDEQKQQFSF